MSKMTFSKMKVSIIGVTPDAFHCNIRIDTRTNVWARSVWVPRSNIRSDDDKRLEEIKSQLESVAQVNTFIHVADWFRDSRKWLAVEA